MASSTSSYSLKRFQNSRDPDFASALLIYVRNTPANIRTDSNEIVYWIDNFSAKFKDDFYVFGFYRNHQLVGYAQAVYFREEQLIVLDYIAIDEAYRGNNVFYEFVDHIRRYLEDAHPEYRYGVTEVIYGYGQQYPSQASRLTIRLLKLQGFKVIRAPYYQPRLTLGDAESETQGDLLIYSTSSLDRIRTETYLSIIHTIYYKHYLRWKNVIPDPKHNYKKHLDGLYSKIKSAVGKKQIILVNGHKAVLPTPRRKPVMTIHRIVNFSMQALLVIILLTTAMLGLKAAFNLSNTSFAVIFVLAISSFMAVAGIVSKEARMIFAEFVSLAKFFSRKKISELKPTELDKESSARPDPDAQ
jgi:hypothetical protein